MKLEFWGAARTVTGSMHLLEANGRRVLLDCGMAQGRRKQAFERFFALAEEIGLKDIQRTIVSMSRMVSM